MYMVSRSKYLKIKRTLRTTRYITLSLLLVELIILAGTIIANAMI